MNSELPASSHWEFETDVPATQAGFDILGGLVPEWATLFVAKNRKYQRVDRSLGARGVFPDVYRKVGVLRDRVWDGNDGPGEPTEEVILDTIGHLFLMLQYLREES